LVCCKSRHYGKGEEFGDAMPENKNVVELHGCIVCARLFNVLVVYAPNGGMLDCSVTSPDGHRVADERHALVACDTHSADVIERSFERWHSKNDKK
jgi:hypothetical protein